MGYVFDKTTGKVIETKSAVSSPTLWAGVGTIALGLIQALPEIVEQVGPLLPPHALGIATCVAGVIVVVRKVFSNNAEIKDIPSDKY